MRYYPCSEIFINDVKNKLSNMVFREQEEIWFLSLHGIYKYINDDLSIFKFNLNEDDEVLNNYINNLDFLITPNTWKKVTVDHRIPTVGSKMKIKTYIFSPSIKSTSKFIMEIYESGKIDYYFTSPEESNNHSLIEDIRLFLDLLT